MRKEADDVVREAMSRIWPAPISETHIELATKIASRVRGVHDLDLIAEYADPRKFTIGEFCPQFIVGNGGPANLEEKSIYLLMMPGPYKEPEGLTERACMASRAARENGAEKVVLLETDFSHGRQDRGVDEDPRAAGELNTVRWHADKYRAAGIDQVITTHAHSPRIAALFAQAYDLVPDGMKFDANNPEIQSLGEQVFKSIPLHAVLADYLLHQSSLVGSEYFADGGARLVLKAVDRGNWSFIENLRDALFLPNASIVYCKKARKVKNDPNKVEVEIDHVSDNFTTLDGKLEIFADDGLDTGGTLMRSTEWSLAGNVCSKTRKSYGTPEDSFYYFTHAWLGGKAFENIQFTISRRLSNAREFVTTNSRPYVSDGQHHLFKRKSTVLRLAGVWADAIVANELGHDITTRYQDFDSEKDQHDFIGPLYALKRHSGHFMVESREHRERKINFYLRE